MPLLQVRDFPQDIYTLLKIKAEAEHRSIAQQITVMLKDALEKDLAVAKERRRQLREKAKNRKVPESLKNFDFVKAIRESREERYVIKQIEKEVKEKTTEVINT